MNVLLYCEPSFCFDLVNINRPDLTIARYFNFFYNPLSNERDISIKAIIPEQISFLGSSFHTLDALNTTPFSLDSLFTAFPRARSLKDIFLCIYNNTYTDEEQSCLGKVLKSLIGNWTPDIIITYPIHNQILKSLFPKAVTLQLENGVLSRAPYPHTLKIDPVHYANGFALKYKEEIKKVELSENDAYWIETLQSSLLRFCEPERKIRNQIISAKGKFSRLLLLPVLASNAYQEHSTDDQVVFIRSTLSQIPKNYGVIVTFHDTVTAQVKSSSISFLQSLYPNLIYITQGKNRESIPSYYLFPYVDAIVNCCTMTGIQAMLHGVRLIAIDKSYSHCFADHIGLSNIDDFLSAPPPNKKPEIKWLLTRGAIFDYCYAADGWMHNYLSKLLSSYSTSGISFQLLPEITSVQIAASHILSVFSKAKRRENIRRHIPDSLLKFLFHIKSILLQN